MQTYKIIYKRHGINSTTGLDPWRVYTDDHGLDLEEKINCCLYYDDDRLVACNLYDVRDLQLPDWVDIKRYLSNPVYHRALISHIERYKMGPDSVSSTAAYRLMDMGTAQVFACLSLLKTKTFRSEFRASLRCQLDKWLDSEVTEFSSPFSHKQWGCLINAHIANAAHRYDYR